MRFKGLPNVLCAIRLALVPVLWVLAIAGLRVPFVTVLALAWFTDAIDGTIARRYHLESRFGARLDSIADNAISLSMVGWVYLLRREMYTQYWHLIVIVFALGVTSMALQYRRRAPLHTYANKATGWVLGVFLLYTFALGVSPAAMWVTFVLLAYSLVEGLVLLLFAPHVDESTRTLWGALRRQRTDTNES